MKKIRTPDELEELRKSILDSRDPSEVSVSICRGTGCTASGGEILTAALEDEIQKNGLKEKVQVRITGCHGFCEQGPLVVIRPQEIFYCQVKPEDAKEIVSETLMKGKICERLLYSDPVSKERVIQEDKVPFYKQQQRILLENNGRIDPTNIEDYIALGGYGALTRVLTQMSPEELIETIKQSGLRGRGGAGFPTGRKWEICRRAPGDLKYIICNADEGDPGAFQDRSLLEGNPHSVLEGMLIGAYAVGAREGYIYVRKEYPLAVKNVGIAIRQLKEHGLLGKDILNSGWGFTMKVDRGAGAFVCGEETGLLASIEGRVGEPRPRPPYPAESGLWGKPTNINNVKTWASVPVVIERGAKWYSGIGTETSKGTMIFSLVGKINNTGLVEVPMGITLRKLIYTIGGGIPRGKKFKAVQTGGPSGGCIPESLIDLAVDYEQLTQAGSIMGSGGMIVMDEDTCMVDVGRYFMNFLKEESCGKCVPCREGIGGCLEILDNICTGKGKIEDISLLEEISETIRDFSLCALGQTAPNPVLSGLRYFRSEYEAHINEKRCPSGVCKALIEYMIDPDKCKACMVCLKVCPPKAISGKKKEPHKIDKNNCTKCGACFDVCKFDAVVRQ